MEKRMCRFTLHPKGSLRDPLKTPAGVMVVTDEENR
jgi:hypothetical protein